MPYKGGVQLLPETQRRPTLASYASGNGYFWFGIAVAIAVVVGAAIFSSYAANLQARIDELDGQLQATEDARNKEQERVLIDAERQSRTMQVLLSSKLYWTQAFERIEDMLRTQVRLTDLSASSVDGTIAFTARADSYATVARQIKAFTEAAGVTDLQVQDISATNDGGIEFAGEITIDIPVMLQKQSPRTTPR